MVTLSDHPASEPSSGNSADYLAALPSAIQDQLARIARICAGMTEDEKLWTRSCFGGMAFHLAVQPRDELVAVGEVMTSTMRILTAMDELAQPSGAVI